MTQLPLAATTADIVSFLPTLNALLNALATCLLVAGYVLIRRRRETAHRNAMLAALAVSMLFLASYVVYHVSIQGSVPFRGPPGLRRAYLAMLASHIVLAALVPFLAVITIYLGLSERRQAHRRLARWTLPIWLYVSTTGVLIYVTLYHVYPAPRSVPILPEEAAVAPPAPPFLPSAELRR